MNNTTKSIVILSCTPYFGNSRLLKALETGVTFSEIIDNPSKYTKSLLLRHESIEYLNNRKCQSYLDKLYSWLENSNNKLVTYTDQDYPENLKHINNPPFVLYCTGNIKLLDTVQLAIVGARNNSTYGKNATYKLCKELKDSNITITSGLAYGIDTLAHKYALENSLNTIAVVGTGVDMIYPSSNRALYSNIISNDGLIISELPLGTTASRYTFPQRNRIISGLSKGVAVIEAASKSGSLITAQHALEQNKEVFAVPGSIFSTSSQGCNELIKQGAKLVCDINDILEEINIDPNNSLQETSTKIADDNINLSNSEKVILDIIGQGLTTIDKIVTESKLPYMEITPILFELELKSLIESVPGGYINTQ
ncbi:DNA-processing protein DprA [Francisella salina]|uniref:Rossmann fold nucleotide-binding protein Smf possibly involved in DNA uptake n=1 Tax=Francisella salina TaxID=573569 RepID=A0ABN3ZKJ2_FRAST|nr:DNA-processing protein DprA [Francisella salina]AEI35300.1 Rossmann fold nucleotide-binding protein Smf possibly involved in DNA uptake [Francisella salina]